MARKLSNLRINRVALVDKGANYDSKTGDGAHIVLFKSAPNVGDVHVDVPIGDEREEYEKATLSSETRNGLPDSAFAAVWTDAQGKKQRKLPYKHADGSIDHGHLTAALGRIDGADIPESVKSSARSKLQAANKHQEKNVKKSILKQFLGLFAEQDVEKRSAAAAALAKAVDEDTVDGGDDETAEDKKKKEMEKIAADAVATVSKAHDAEVASLKKRLEDSENAAKIEKDARLDREMTDVLKSFKATPFDLTTDVAKFRKMKEDAPEAYARTMELFKAADAQAAASGLYKNFGSGGQGGGSAWDKIEAKADALIEKSGHTVTREVALEKVMLANPALVAEYRKEQQ